MEGMTRSYITETVFVVDSTEFIYRGAFDFVCIGMNVQCISSFRLELAGKKYDNKAAFLGTKGTTPLSL